jgi:trehalose-6-phosphate synthase
MRITLAFILSIIVAVGLVAFGFTLFQISEEKSRLLKDIESRTLQISEEILKNDSLFFNRANPSNIENLADSLKTLYNLIGIAVYYRSDSIVANNASREFLAPLLSYVPQSIASGRSMGSFVSISDKKIYQFIVPVIKENKSANAILLFTDTKYVDRILSDIWMKSFIRWFVQALLVSVITIITIRWAIFNPIKKVVAWAKALRSGNPELLSMEPPVNFLAPIHREIEHIAKAMVEAKANAEEEARLRTSSEAIWTPERLKIEVENLLEKKMMVVVSNREPYMHIHTGKEIECIVPASGMITAMEPILTACSGLWIAAGSGDADRETVDKNDKVQVPPDDPKYTLRRLWLTREEEKHFYYGFSNEGLWPLCHIAHTRPIFRFDDWNHYKKVNEYFANVVLKETEGESQPYILIQDFHFALMPDLIRRKKPDAKIAIFWHIPWPNPESFGICPWQREILRGMLGADLIGFHTQYHCNHFLETVSAALEARVLWENFSVKIGGQTTLVNPFPISIAFTLKDYDNPSDGKLPSEILAEHGITAKFMGVGVDRIDYTKGIVEKFLAIERFLEKYPAYVGKFTFVQIGAPSRTLLKSYSDIVSAVEHEAGRINMKFKARNWKAILLLKRHHSHNEINPYYASANFCMVTSLHDGMNLVAKEFIASRSRNDGGLILSRFAGAARELYGAIIINPYDIEQSADAIKIALEMTVEEQTQRMKLMRLTVVRYNIFSWAANLLRTMAAINH